MATKRTGAVAVSAAYAIAVLALVHLAIAYAGTDAKPAAAAREGVHDFAWEHGTWKTHVARLKQPLSGSDEWVEYDGTTVVRPLLGGRANVAELDVSGPAGRIEGVSLRLYDPSARQWSLNWSNVKAGALDPPVTGRFVDGRGEFSGRETIDGRTIEVRFTIACSDARTCRFEQSFSADGGATWETNWIATDTRIDDTTCE